jgi:uncharacterized membrane protein
MTEKKEFNLTQFFNDHIIDFALIVAIAIYILARIANIEESGLTWQQLIAEGGTSYLFGFLIKRLMGIKGVINGEKNKKVITANELFTKTRDKITHIIEKLDAYCDRKNETEIKRVQSIILTRAGLKYEEWAKQSYDYTALSEVQKKAYDRASSIQIALLSADKLLSSNNEKDETKRFDFGQTLMQFMGKSSGWDLAGSALFGTFALVHLVFNGFTWIALLYGAVQVAVFLMFGVWAYMKHYLFVTETLRGQTIKKINYLEEFYNEEQNYGSNS